MRIILDVITQRKDSSGKSVFSIQHSDTSADIERDAKMARHELQALLDTGEDPMSPRVNALVERISRPLKTTVTDDEET